MTPATSSSAAAASSASSARRSPASRSASATSSRAPSTLIAEVDGPRDRGRRRQVGADRPKDRRDADVDRNAGDLPPSGRQRARRPRHRRPRRRGDSHLQERRVRRAAGAFGAFEGVRCTNHRHHREPGVGARAPLRRLARRRGARGGVPARSRAHDEHDGGARARRCAGGGACCRRRGSSARTSPAFIRAAPSGANSSSASRRSCSARTCRFSRTATPCARRSS